MGWLDPLSWLKWATGIIIVSVASLGVGLYSFQTKLIYPAGLPEGSRTIVALPSDFGMPDEELTLETPDGVKIKAYLIPVDNDPHLRPTVILLHANAGNVGHRLPIAKVFYRKMNCNVLALSYRGYGRSEGSPNEKGLRLDAQTALDYVLSHPTLEKTQIYAFGQSIGGAVAIDLASRNSQRIHGLIVENTFLSLPKLVPNVLPFVAPFLFLLHQVWPSEERIALLPPAFPTLFLSGVQDELVPPRHMKELFARCSSKNKEWAEFDDGTHNDTCLQPHYFTRVAEFIATHSQLSDPTSPLTTLTPSSDPEKVALAYDTSIEKSSDAPEEQKEKPEGSVAGSSVAGSSVADRSDEEGSFEMVDRDEGDAEKAGLLGAGSVGPEDVAREKVTNVQEKL